MNAHITDPKPPAPEAPLARSIIDSLPNPLIVIDANECICLANAAAENYFQASSNVLTRQALRDIVPFSSPVFGAIAQTRGTARGRNEYPIAVGTPALGRERLVQPPDPVKAEHPRLGIRHLAARVEHGSQVVQRHGHQVMLGAVLALENRECAVIQPLGFDELPLPI